MYDIDTTTPTVLFIWKHLQSGELDEFQQAYLIVKKVFGKEAPVEQKIVDLASKLLSFTDDAKNNKIPEQRFMCLVQDYPIYRADIIREYDIDIEQKIIDFKDLVMLIENLSSDAKLNQVIEIRTKKLSDIKDHKERKLWRDAQNHYKLKDITPVSKETKELEKKDKEVMNNFLNKFK